MGFLAMIGAVSAEENAKQVKAARDEEADTIASLNAQLTDARRGFVDQQAKFKRATADLEAAVTARDEAVEKYSSLSTKYADIADEVIALRAELATFRAARDRDNENRKLRRAKAVTPTKAVANPVAKAKPAKKAVR